jgi:hypothetical protein
MAYDRFLIAPIISGLEKDLKPWIIPDDAFAELNNAYVFRGRIRKRFGSYFIGETDDQLLSRLRINIGTTDPVTGNFSLTPVPGTVWEEGQLFSIGTTIFTVASFAAGPQPMLTTGAATGTFDITTGSVVITGNGENPLTPVYFYPAQPVMGFITYETINVNDEPTYAFDTQFAYEYISGAWERLGTAIWTGSNSQFFWGYTYRGVNAYDRLLFVTNFNAPDLIKYWDGAVWTNFNPVIDQFGNTLETCRIIVGFKNRLLFLNTVEKISGVNRSFVNRLRFSRNGDPTDPAVSFNASLGEGAGFIDNQATQESIITAEFLKDRLIVFYERSTWEVVYTGNEVAPFQWQQINTELGAESTFSIVPFDKVTIGVGNVGIHACNGANVERIDEKIPDEVFEISNDQDGVFRVWGIRDFFVEMVYWTFPTPNSSKTFPDRVLIYNYKTGSWAFNDDSITAFGYFQNVEGLLWQDATELWQEAEETWNSATIDSKFRQIIAGNQEGFTFICDSEISRNAPVLQVTDIDLSTPSVAEITIINHNLSQNDFITLEHLNGITIVDSQLIFQVARVVNVDTIEVFTDALSGTYLGGGTSARVSRIDMTTKQFNPYVDKARNVYVAKIDFLVDRTENGEITIDYWPSSTSLSMIDQGTLSQSIMGTSVLETTPFSLLYPLENVQERLWHPVYLQTDGESIQMHIYLTDDQMFDKNIAFSDFEMHALCLHTQAVSNNLQ